MSLEVRDNNIQRGIRTCVDHQLLLLPKDCMFMSMRNVTMQAHLSVHVHILECNTHIMPDVLCYVS